MVTQEMARAVMGERMREFAELDRIRQAERLQRRTERPRSGPSQPRKRSALFALVTRPFHTASV